MVVRKGHRYGGQEGSQIWWSKRDEIFALL